MKKSIILLPILLIFSSAFGQDYFPFPSSGAIWNHNIVNFEGTPYVSYRYRLGIIGDTIINSKQYSKVYQLEGVELNILNSDYVGAIREEDKKIYAITVCDGEPEVLLYDFDVEVGDIINSNTIQGYLSEPIEVLDIEEIELLDGTIRKKINVGVDYWIEGIGSKGGLFAPITAMPLNYTSVWLKCFNHNETNVYIDSYTSGLSCELCFCVLDTPSFEISDRIIVYPNPFTNKLDIELETNSIFDVNIFDSTGAIVKQLRNLSSNTLDLKNLVNGIYLIQVIDDDRIYYKKIIKEQE